MSDRHAIESPTVLANRGVPVVVFKAEQYTPEGTEEVLYRKVHDEGGDYATEHRYVHLSAWSIAQIEEKYGSLDLWQKAMTSRTFTCVLDALSIIWRQPREKVAEILLEGRIEEYVIALQVASYRAQGVPVDDLGKLLKRGMEATATGLKVLTAVVGKMSEADIEVSDEDIESFLTGTAPEPAPEPEQTPEPEPEPETEPAEPPAPTRGTSGSARGSKRAAPSKNSGPRPRRRSASSSAPS